MFKRKAFQRDQTGATALIFGLAVLPLMLTMGAALDYGRAVAARTTMQIAVDAAALALARDGAGLSDSQIADLGRKYFDANFTARDRASITSVRVTRKGQTIDVTAAGAVKTAVIGLLRVDTIGIAARAQSAWGQNKVELALVLDNTLSMADVGKMAALKQAAHELLDTLRNAASQSDTFKIAIVPFATHVNVGTGFNTASWLDFGHPGLDVVIGTIRANIAATKTNWTGCIADRDQPYDVSDAAPVVGTRSTLFPAILCVTPVTPARPLTSDYPALGATVDAMVPAGLTNVTVGVAWGLAALSPGAPFSEAQPFGTKNLDKIMIVLTDGDNTASRFNTVVSAIDDRTRLACAEVKRNGVKVYTIRVIKGNADLLRDCATSPGMYHEVASAGELVPVFKAIADEISAIRLTQ